MKVRIEPEDAFELAAMLLSALLTILCGAFVGLLLVISAHADTLGVHLLSLHVPDRDQQDFNPGLYWKSDNGVTLGAYRNSIDRLSIYAGLTIEEGPWALTGGVMYGYQRRPVCSQTFTPRTTTTTCIWSPGTRTPFAPLLSPSVRLGSVFGVVPRLTLIPGFKGSSTVLHFSIEREL